MRKKTAKWIQHTHLFKRDEFECSSCHARSYKPYKVCPRCGSKMSGTGYDPSWVDEIERTDAMLDD